MASILSLISEKVGSELFKLFKVSSKSVGMVTFWRLSRLGTLICGALMSLNGLTLFMASMAVEMAELAD